VDKGFLGGGTIAEGVSAKTVLATALSDVQKTVCLVWIANPPKIITPSSNNFSHPD